MSNRPGALRLEPKFLPKVWAAPRPPAGLAGIMAVPPGTGEVWLASDRHTITAVVEGDQAGKGLDVVYAEHAAWLTGSGSPPPSFPLLLKLLLVGDWLSVQVHPDDQTARELENEPWGKSEAWHVLAAEPEAAIVHGLAPGAGKREVARAVEEGKVAEVLAKVPARAGDTFNLPAGVLHTIGPGLTLFEVQQASDLTYRFYDWDRPGDDGRPRALHLAKALKALKPSGPGRPEPLLTPVGAPRGIEQLVISPAFNLYRGASEAPYHPWREEEGVALFFVLAGRAGLSAAGRDFEMLPGQTWLLPAGVAEWSILPRGGEFSFLEATV